MLPSIPASVRNVVGDWLNEMVSMALSMGAQIIQDVDLPHNNDKYDEN